MSLSVPSHTQRFCILQIEPPGFQMVKRVLCREIEMKGCDGHATLRHCLKIRPGLLVVAELIAVDEVAPPYATLLPNLHPVSIYSLAQRSQAKSGEFTPFAIRIVDVKEWLSGETTRNQGLQD